MLRDELFAITVRNNLQLTRSDGAREFHIFKRYWLIKIIKVSAYGDLLFADTRS